MLQSISEHMRGKNVEYLSITASIAFLIATLLVLPFVDSYYGFNQYIYSLFQPTILLIGVAAVAFLAVLSRLIKEKGLKTDELLGDSIDRIVGKPILVSADDKRAPIDKDTAAAEAFKGA